jgi:hypothetical protein
MNFKTTELKLKIWNLFSSNSPKAGLGIKNGKI